MEGRANINVSYSVESCNNKQRDEARTAAGKEEEEDEDGQEELKGKSLQRTRGPEVRLQR